MPPSRTSPKSYVYAITRRDFDHHTDEEGRLELIEIHGSLSSANEAAKAHLEEESESALDDDPETEERETEDGRYDGYCWTREDERDNFHVSVEKMELMSGKLVNKGVAPS